MGSASRIGSVLLGLGLMGAGFGFGRWVDGRSPKVDLDLVDGKVAFAAVKGDGAMVVDWGEARVSPGQRSFALVFEQSRPQLLVYPREAAWPALAVPKGWRVAWIERSGEILEVQDCEGGSLSSKRPGAGKAFALFSAPGGSALAQSLEVGRRLAWSGALGGRPR